MAQVFDRRLFEQIFSDAHVVDVDFSQWDKVVSLCVVADHVEVLTPARLPLFIVDFLGVSKFFLTFNHLEVDLEDVDQHFQWNIDDFTIEEANQRITISLFGGATWPKVDIESRDIAFRRLPHAMLDDLFPGWNAPYKGLARPGIESLSRLLKSRR